MHKIKVSRVLAFETSSTAAIVGASTQSRMYSGMCESPGDESTLAHHSQEKDVVDDDAITYVIVALSSQSVL